MNKTAPICVALAAALLAAGCRTPTTYVRDCDPVPAMAALGNQDVRAAATELTDSLLRSGRLDAPGGGLYVVTVGKVVNDTMQHFDTDILTDMITDELTASGKVAVTAAITGANDKPDRVDSTLAVTRQARGNDEFNQSTVPGKGNLVAGSFSLSGRISQRENLNDNGDKQVDYYFRMRLVDQTTGLEVWARQVYVGKITDRRSPTW